MLTASEEQKEELEKRIRKLKEDERDRANELERQGIEDRRNNEAELQRLRRKHEVSIPSFFRDLNSGLRSGLGTMMLTCYFLQESERQREKAESEQRNRIAAEAKAGKRKGKAAAKQEAAAEAKVTTPHSALLDP